MCEHGSFWQRCSLYVKHTKENLSIFITPLMCKTYPWYEYIFLSDADKS